MSIICILQYASEYIIISVVSKIPTTVFVIKNKTDGIIIMRMRRLLLYVIIFKNDEIKLLLNLNFE